ncbi:MAG: inositol monophosphatase family protein [Actinomycetota bacterium]|jgi:histidinol phosphatase-like enzyme (inositol monophosphatase family)|nr:inositol monophosphatase family protein [Actinomycetota bacterium]
MIEGAELDSIVELAVEAADRALLVTMGLFRDPDLGVESKAYRSYVTAADKEAELAIRHLVAQERPGDGIIGEEWAEVDSTTGVTWTLDPIDGTMSFVHGVPGWSTLIGIEDDEGPLVGVIDVPAIGQRAVAARGRGCKVDGRDARVSAKTDLTEATILTSGMLDYWTPDALDRVLTSGAIVRTWADGGWGYVLLAEGRIDAMADMQLNEWDYAASLVVVPEAGGAIAVAPDSGVATVAASNGHLQDQLLDTIFGPSPR